MRTDKAITLPIADVVGGYSALIEIPTIINPGDDIPFFLNKELTDNQLTVIFRAAGILEKDICEEDKRLFIDCLPNDKEGVTFPESNIVLKVYKHYFQAVTRHIFLEYLKGISVGYDYLPSVPYNEEGWNLYEFTLELLGELKVLDISEGYAETLDFTFELIRTMSAHLIKEFERDYYQKEYDLELISYVLQYNYRELGQKRRVGGRRRILNRESLVSILLPNIR